MTAIKFGMNHSYYIEGGSIAQRYIKRLELQDQHPDAKRVIMAFDAEGSSIQILTADDDEKFDTDAAIERAREQCNVINLDA